MRESSQDVARFGVPASGKSQTFQRNHGVAAPIGEPRIARDDGANLVASSASADRIVFPAFGNDYELIGGKHEFRGWRFRGNVDGACEQTLATQALRVFGILRTDGADRFPRFGGGYQCDRLVGREKNRKIS